MGLSIFFPAWTCHFHRSKRSGGDQIYSARIREIFFFIGTSRVRVALQRRSGLINDCLDDLNIARPNYKATQQDQKQLFVLERERFAALRDISGHTFHLGALIRWPAGWPRSAGFLNWKACAKSPQALTFTTSHGKWSTSDHFWGCGRHPAVSIWLKRSSNWLIIKSECSSGGSRVTGRQDSFACHVHTFYWPPPWEMPRTDRSRFMNEQTWMSSWANGCAKKRSVGVVAPFGWGFLLWNTR